MWVILYFQNLKITQNPLPFSGYEKPRPCLKFYNLLVQTFNPKGTKLSVHYVHFCIRLIWKRKILWVLIVWNKPVRANGFILASTIFITVITLYFTFIYIYTFGFFCSVRFIDINKAVVAKTFIRSNVITAWRILVTWTWFVTFINI